MNSSQSQRSPNQLLVLSAAFASTLVLAIGAFGQSLSSAADSPAAPAESATPAVEVPVTITNGLSQSVRQAVVSPARVTPHPRPAVDAAKQARIIPSHPTKPEREIVQTPEGAAARFGRLKVQFAPDAADPRPITITTPDGKTLACRATYLALHDSVSGQSLMLGEVTNCIGYITGPTEIVYSNAFDTIRADIRYRYQGTNAQSLTQDVILEEQPQLPETWRDGNVTLEVWTEWFGQEQPTVTPRTVQRRPATGSAAAVTATDHIISLGNMRFTGPGRAFNLQSPSNSVPVFKTWSPASKEEPGRGNFLIESLDYLSMKPNLNRLPKGTRHGSASLIDVERARLLRSLAATGSLRPAVAGKAGTTGREPMLLAAAPKYPNAAVVLDFELGAPTPLPSGSVAWWRADDDATDCIGNHNGTLQGNATYGTGEVGDGFSLNGTSAYLTVPSSWEIKPSGPFTIEGWVKYENVQRQNCNGMAIVSKGVDADVPQDWALAISADYHLRPHLKANGGWYVYNCNTVLASNTWYHVAMVYDGSNLIGYVNGNEDGNCTFWGEVATSDENLRIGAYAPSSSTARNFFPGSIDELTIYNRALSASEIDAIFEAGGAGKYIPVSHCSEPPYGIVAWWPAEGNTTEVIGGANGTFHGSEQYMPGGAFWSLCGSSFVFGDQSWVEATPSPATSFGGNDFSIELWVDFWNLETSGSLSTPDGVFVARSMGPYYYDCPKWAFGRYDGQLCFFVGRQSGDSYLVQAPYNFEALNYEYSTWYHLAVVRSGSGISIYVNGLVVGSDTFDFDIPPFGEDSSGGSLTLGACDPTGYTPGFLRAFMDEVTIYNHALSESEIAAIYSAARCGKCADRNQNGLPDDWEIAHFGQLVNANSDGDNDGLSIAQEYYLHSDPNHAATSGNVSIEVYSPRGN
jgi:hypothetical protein